ncbi:hypothetical protein CFS9_41620 [Flavobacterium sp. CFS9]|uniref:DUF5655 domain-containing protein n=1 Tax=Flavobacterium sp. CFS9 TaxID=3143118 RepID=A0AAT9H7Q8_9FLAO
MSDKLKYIKAEKISIRQHFNEKWLQDRIEEDTSILGLGELDVIHRERKQSSGGRIDFLFLNNDTDIMYETEIMLGKTDESHIIRAIEYWDIERRRFPSKDHRAVIIAEDITNRFFNVIALMNRAIPIIAIQVSALKIDSQIILNFTTVLDIYEEPEDEEKLGGEEVGRQYWVKKSHTRSIAMLDEMIKFGEIADANLKVTYNKHHVALGTSRQNSIWLRPRKTPSICHMEVKVGKENIENVKEELADIGISFNLRKDDIFAISIRQEELTKHQEYIKGLIAKSLLYYQ